MALSCLGLDHITHYYRYRHFGACAGTTHYTLRTALWTTPYTLRTALYGLHTLPAKGPTLLEDRVDALRLGVVGSSHVLDVLVARSIHALLIPDVSPRGNDCATQLHSDHVPVAARRQVARNEEVTEVCKVMSLLRKLRT